MRKAIALIAGLALSFTMGSAAVAGNSSHNPRFKGLLSSVDGDSNPSTPGPFVISNPVGVNDAGRNFLADHSNPTSLTVNLESNTKYRGPSHLGRTADNYRVGDFVAVKAVADSDNTSVDARIIKLFLQHYEGDTLVTFTKATGTSDGSGSFTTTGDSENAAATAWQTTNTSAPVTNFTMTVHDKVSGHPAPADSVDAAARPSASDPSTLEVLHLSKA